MKPTQLGLARLDVLVLSVLVVLTVGLLLPAAQEVKEAENRKRCANHLKQLGLATHCFSVQYGKLPPGWLGPLDNQATPDFKQTQNLSVLVFLLPYGEQYDLCREIMANGPADYFNLNATRPAWFTIAGMRKAASALIPGFLCPSAPSTAKAADGILVGVHFANTPKGIVTPSSHTLPPNDPAFEKLGRTNYFGVAGLWGRGTNTAFPDTQLGLGLFEGVFTNRSSNMIDQISSEDGTSNTLLFGEGTGGSHDGAAAKPSEKSPAQYGASWCGGGALPTGGGLTRHGEPSYWYQFSSAHESVVNFCYVDGAVRALRSGTTGTAFLPTSKLPREPRDASAASPYWCVQELAGFRDGGLRPRNLIEPR